MGVKNGQIHSSVNTFSGISLPLVALSVVSSGRQIVRSHQPDQEASPSYNQDLSTPGLKQTNNKHKVYLFNELAVLQE